MVVTYLGKSLVKVQVGELVVAINPFEKGDSGKAVKFGADIVLSSCTDEDHAGIDNVTYGNKVPFVADTPGEYEIAGTYITGLHTDTISIQKNTNYPNGKKRNTTFCILLENMTLCHLGAQHNEAINGETIEKMGHVDILVIPVGEDGLTPKGAYTLSKKIDPKIIIPVSHGGNIKKGALGEFIKEVGQENLKPQEKLVIKKKDLESKEGEVVVLST